MLEFIKSNKVLIIVLVVFLALILIRSTGMNHFSPDAAKLAEPSFKGSNTVTIDKLGEIKGSNLIINLNQGNDSLLKGISGDIRNIPAESILSNENLKAIKQHNGNVLVYSSDPALSARIWMLLSQMGRKDLYILMADKENEVLKYKL